jgi:eukaryotic-like serine/threonine-protein kinase
VGDLREQLQDALADRYHLDRELGRGGMATVFLAHDYRHDRAVALKVLHAELAATLGPERFQREIKTAARLQHPHILTLLDSGEAAGQLWFTMPYVEGESLRDLLRREVQLPVNAAIQIARELALALAYAHRHGVVHRDIKPENILLSDGQALIADFGLAKALGDAGEHLTATGLAIGTPAYMSPEQAMGDRFLDARTDVYALGTVLYEMLVGEPPFTGPTAQAVIAKRLCGDVPGLRTVRPTVPVSVEQAVMRALAPVKADRISTAAEFARALEMSSAGPTIQPPAAHRTVAVEAAPAFHRPRRQLLLVGSTLALGLLVGIGVLFTRRQSLGGGSSLDGAKVLAVLPFDHLGDSADAYFAEGVANDVRTKLSQVIGLAVIARTSSNEYRHTRKTAQQIARELGASYLLTATVQWEKRPGRVSRVRVTPELIEVGPGHAPRTRWGQQFDASMMDVFQVQTDIATQVVNALDVALSESNRRQLAIRPTQNLYAYDSFLRGRQKGPYAGHITPTAMRSAEAEFQRAVKLDSTFAAAWAGLAMTHIALYRLGGTQIADAEAARVEVERAFALAPDLPEVRAANGMYKQIVLGNIRGALDEYEAGLRISPSSGDLLGLAADADFTLGRQSAAIERLETAVRLDPRSARLAIALARTYLETRRYVDAQRAVERARALGTSGILAPYTQALLHASTGNLQKAREALRLAYTESDSTTVVAYVAIREELIWLLQDAEQRLLLSLTPAALDSGRADWAIALAQTYWLRGDRYRARAYGDTAAVAFVKLIRQRANVADRAQLVGLHGLALAYSGRMHEAKMRGREALAIVQTTTAPAWQLAYIQLQVARIELLAGQSEVAIDRLGFALKHSGLISAGWLKIDTRFASLRGNPRFERLVRGP